MYDELEARDTVVVAVSQEEKELSEERYGPFLAKLEPYPRFDVLVDVQREVTSAYDRTTAYLIDKEGRVRQIFPMIIHARPSWRALLPEIDRLAEDPR